jgi:signal transduction histidine kinase
MPSTYSQALRELSEPRPGGDLVKRAIERASKLSGLTYTRAFDVWYGKARRIDAHEAQQIAEALEKKREHDARNEIHDLRTRLLKMESRLAAERADSPRSGLGLTREQVRRLGGVDRPMGSRTR